MRLDDDERGFLRRVIGELRDVLVAGVGADGDVPEPVRRLFPTAHPSDPEAEAGYRSLMRDQLLAGRLEAIERVEESLDATELDDDLADRWMGVVNDVRLTLGTVLDVSEGDDPAIDPDEADATARFAYAYLSGLLEELVDARSDGWVPPGDQAGNQ